MRYRTGLAFTFLCTLVPAGVPVAIVLIPEAGGASQAVASYLETGTVAKGSPFASFASELAAISARNEECGGDAVTIFRSDQPEDIGLCTLQAIVYATCTLARPCARPRASWMRVHAP